MRNRPQLSWGTKNSKGKVWSSNRELCPSFRESLKSCQTLLLWLELCNNILSHAEGLPLLQTHHSYHVTGWLLLSHNKYWASPKDSWEFTASSSVPSYTPVCFIPARDISDPWRASGIRSTGLACLLAMRACIIHTAQHQQRLMQKSLS